ncbi:hypothetical protein [Rhodopirellula sp. MGV]|uniref:hypothetical protein n=1 Tax=Rhodopirellula sp. MGV TaxID=2023130 RepID=UPI000B96CFD1|nr:hypothetical protein [Rhodopirellula sp. MGV]OYP31635.1 hypothetical protein CGZ80_21035 [Rhodopirellula sp. MGV]PNY33464.1 hypothetical protein C2E31_28645 [Rhodopirellula baltica]
MQRLRITQLSSLVAFAACFCISAPTADAHEGPPFPVQLDQPAAGYKISTWADPDIGEARFFIIVETESGEMPNDEPTIRLWTEPVDQRLPRETYEATKQSLRGSLQFLSKPLFDKRDHWNVGIQITSPSGEAGETIVQVESTPPGYGPWDLAIYLFPFALIGGAWCVAMAKRVWHIQQAAENHPKPESKEETVLAGNDQ